MNTHSTQPAPEGKQPARSLGVEGYAGVAAFEQTEGPSKRKGSLSPDSLNSYRALYEGVPALQSVANDPLAELAPTGTPTATQDIQTPNQVYTLFSLLADMSLVFKAEEAKMRSVNQELGAVSGQINTMLQTITSFANAVAATNAQIKAEEPAKWIQVLEGIAFVVVGMAMGAAFGGPVAAVAAAVVGIGNVIMNNATVKTADGKEENLWDASLGGLNPGEQFLVKLLISVSAGVIAGAGTAALSNFAQASSEAAELEASELGTSLEGGLQPSTLSTEFEDEGEMLEMEEMGEGRITQTQDQQEQLETQEEVEGGKEKAVSGKSWAQEHPVLARSILPNVGRRAFLGGLNTFLSVASSIKSNVSKDDKSGELGLFGDLAKWCGLSDDKAGYLDSFASILQTIVSLGSGALSAANPSNVEGLMKRVMEGLPLLSSGLEGGVSIGNAVTEFKIGHLYEFLAGLTKHVDLANKDMQTLEWNQRILNGMLRQTIKENTSSMQTVNSVLETIQVGLSSQGHQRA